MKVTLEPLPMKEAESFWSEKVLLSPGEFARLSNEAGVRAFAVSGIAKGDELQTVFDALQRAISKGTTFEDFKKEAASVFARRGWTGLRTWRVDNIFRTNIQTAYNVGRYKQMKAAVKTRPFWQYDAVNDGATRPTHRGMDGRVFPADHSFWNKWYPPNGFRCRCGVTSLSQDDINEEGLTVETKDPTGELFHPVDHLTGTKLPPRPLMPDHGFSHNPGKTVWGGVVDAYTGKAPWKSMTGFKGAGDYRRRALKNVRPADIDDLAGSALLPGGKGDDFYKNEFVRRYGEEKVLRDAAGEPVVLSMRSFLVDKAPGAKEVWKFSKAGHGESIPLLSGMIEKPFEIWLTPQTNDDGRVRLTKRYISLWKSGDKERVGGLMVFEVAGGVFQGVTAFVPFKKGVADIDYLEKQREGLLLYGKKGR